MAANMSDQKRLGIACGTPLAMLLLAMGAGSLSGSVDRPASQTVAVAHDNFHAAAGGSKPVVTSEELTDTEVSPAMIRETVSMTSLKPAVASPATSIADQSPEIETDSAAPATQVDAEPEDDSLANDIAQAKETETDVVDPAVPQSSVNAAEDAVAELATIATNEVPESVSDAAVPSDSFEAVITEPTDESKLIDPVDWAETTESELETDTVLETETVMDESTVSVADVDTAPSSRLDVADLSIVEKSNKSDEIATLSAADPTAKTSTESAANGESELTEASNAESASVTETENLSDVPVNLPDVEEPPASTASKDITAATTAVADKPPTTGDGSPKTDAGKPFLGVGIRNPAGNVITTLYAKSTAAKLGVALGDQLVSVNGKPVTSLDTLRTALSDLAVSDATTLEVIRNGERLSLGPLPLGSR